MLVIFGPLIGLAGTIWSIRGSFSALETNESAGIGPVGMQLEYAIAFTVGGLVAVVLGVILIVIGIRRSNH